METRNAVLTLPAGAAVQGTVEAPASKSATHRALIAGALAEGPLVVRRPLDAADTRATLAALAAMGWDVGMQADAWRVGSRIAIPELPSVALGASGTSLRFIAALAAAVPGGARLDGVPRLRERPLAGLLEALAALDARFEAQSQGAGATMLPLAIRPGERREARNEDAPIEIDGSASSQFLSALLLVAPRLGGLTLRARNLVSRPYVDLTIALMRERGIDVDVLAPDVFRVPAGVYRGGEQFVEGDWSSASYFFAAAAVSEGQVTVTRLAPDSRQGDRAFLDVLERMGCRVLAATHGVAVAGGPLRATDASVADMPDMLPGLAAVAACASGTSRFTGAAHLRGKESNRLEGLAAELGRAGVAAHVEGDDLVVRGGLPAAPAPVEIDPYDDHRLAMAFAVLALRRPGLTIRNPGCVEKSFPDFFSAWRRIGAWR